MMTNSKHHITLAYLPRQMECMKRIMQTAIILNVLMANKIGLNTLFQFSFLVHSIKQFNTGMSPMVMYHCEPKMPFQLVAMEEVPIEALIEKHRVHYSLSSIINLRQHT